MTGKKKMILTLGAVFTLTTVSLSTFAYMSDKKQVVNYLEFIGEEGMAASLQEPSWQPEKGLLTVPGMTLEKDPQVTNTSDMDMDELVALKCEFVYTDKCPEVEKRGKILSTEDMAKVTDYMEVDYNSDDPEKEDWVRFESQSSQDPVQCFYYKNPLKRNYPEAGDTTVPLFTRIQIPEQVNNRRQQAVEKIGGVEIRITGTILQHMEGDEYWGVDTAQNAYEAGLFGLDESMGEEVEDENPKA